MESMKSRSFGFVARKPCKSAGEVSARIKSKMSFGRVSRKREGLLIVDFAGEVVQGLHTHGLIVLVDRVDEDDNARLVAILEICHTEGWPAKDYWTHSTRMRD